MFAILRQGAASSAAARRQTVHEIGMDQCSQPDPSAAGPNPTHPKAVGTNGASVSKRYENCLSVYPSVCLSVRLSQVDVLLKR